ncbi:MAG: DUF3459 domain-containing protein, partial [Betaproteobacteria bacterium]
PFRAAAPNAARHNVLAQRTGTRSILRHYEDMLTLRNTRASIARGSWERAFADGLVMGFERVLDGERTLVLINYGPEVRNVRLPQSAAPSGPSARLLWASEPAMAGRLQAAFNTVAFEPQGQRLAPQSVQVWDLSGQHLSGRP